MQVVAVRLTAEELDALDAAARLLETVVIVFENGDEMVIHAMTARKKYLDLLS